MSKKKEEDNSVENLNEQHQGLDQEVETEEKQVEQDPLETLQLQLAELNDKYLRLQAEFDNYRKRTMKEKVDMMKSAGVKLIEDLLPVVDDFDRGMEVIEKSEDVATKEGILLIYNKLKDFLKRNELQEIEAIGSVFDLDKHEAITKIPAPSEDLKGKVVDCVQKGYVLNDRVVRFAKVVVGE